MWEAFRLILAVLVLSAPAGAAGAAVLQTPKGPVEIREASFGGASWVCASEVAVALGGTYAVDKTYQRPVMQALGHRVLLSEETPVYSVDGKVLRLSRAPVQKDGCLYLPTDFLSSLGSVSPSASPAGPQLLPALDKPVEILLDAAGMRLTLQGAEIARARTREEGRSVEVHLASGSFGQLPPFQPTSGFEGGEMLTGKRGIRILFKVGISGEVLRLKNPDRLVVVANSPASPAPPSQPAPPPQDSANAAPRGGELPQEPESHPGAPLIVLDPGHGGSEVGAEGPGGVLEKDLTLALAQRAKTSLERAGFRVLLTRTTDVLMTLQARTVFANTHKANFFICIHVNASPSPKARGTETYYHSTEATDLWAKGLADRENAVGAMGGEAHEGLSLVLWDLAQAGHIRMSAMLAEAVQKQFNELLSTRDRGVRQAPFAVLQGAQMPAVLLEVAFLTNPAEAKKLGGEDFQEQVALSLAEAVKTVRAADQAPAPVGRP